MLHAENVAFKIAFQDFRRSLGGLPVGCLEMDNG